MYEKVDQTYEYLEKISWIIDIHYENSNFPIFIPLFVTMSEKTINLLKTEWSFFGILGIEISPNTETKKWTASQRKSLNKFYNFSQSALCWQGSVLFREFLGCFSDKMVPRWSLAVLVWIE